MREINNLNETYLFCKALGSEIRIKIIKLLHENKSMNLNELSDVLGVTNGAMTAHIKLLVDAGIIEITHSSGKRGSQKICSLKETKVLVNPFHCGACATNMYAADIPIGSFCNCDVSPACGLATSGSIVGEIDDPRYFCAPERVSAGILWFSNGFLEFRIPNYLKQGQTLKALKFSFEISSQVPTGREEYPSNISFTINDLPLGFWSSPGNFGGGRGRYNPAWWPDGWAQSGLLKVLTINQEGVFIDGTKISDTTVNDLAIDFKSSILLRLSVSRTRSINSGGITLFGKDYGNYNQDIHFEALYKEAGAK
ncbi:MAG: ArsR/SmtB family transcription factor [Oscillospiraceae bacterium]|jgi:predicted transcriptional regulator